MNRAAHGVETESQDVTHGGHICIAQLVSSTPQLQTPSLAARHVTTRQTDIAMMAGRAANFPHAPLARTARIAGRGR